jgi:rhodanese-related sulfurtransferase
MVYREGLIGWAKAGYPVERTVEYPNIRIPLISPKALSAINFKECQLIDIRPKASYAKGHIPGAINIDLEILHEQLSLLNNNKKIILIDHKGKLTLTTGRFIAGHGYQNSARLDGGFNAWVKTGLPIEK